MDGVERRTRSVERALAVLSALAETTEPLGVSQLARSLELPKSTVHLALQTMRNLGFVEQDADSDRYVLGLQAARLGMNALHGSRVVGYLSRGMKELANRSGEAVSLGIRQASSVVFIQRFETVHRLSTSIRVGTHMPLHASATGKVILAALDDDEVCAIYPDELLPEQTEKSIRTRSGLLAELAEVRARGCASNLDEFHDGVSAAAVAVRLGSHVIGALSIAGPTARFQAADWIDDLMAVVTAPPPEAIVAGGSHKLESVESAMEATT